MLSGLLGVLVIVLGLGVVGYHRMKTNALDDLSRRTLTQLQQRVVSLEAGAIKPAPAAEVLEPNEGDSLTGATPAESLDNDLEITSDQQTGARFFVELGEQAMRIEGVRNIAIYDSSRALLWSSQQGIQLSNAEQESFSSVARDATVSYQSFEHSLLSLNTWRRVLVKDFTQTPILAAFRLQDGSTNVVKMLVDSQQELSAARRVASRLMMIVGAGTLLLFLLLYSSFRRGIKKISEQEQKMNHQIARLSNLLNVNKSMQKSMKTASARAVELNEQFLRRVGADLHDGPAQMIGFSVLRLNQVSKQEDAKQFGHEFHAVREALDEALEEIRGISSGLVLPELQQLSLEECLRKVITLHGTKSDAVVKQYYQDIPDDIPLPIKICAYRFLQEGLNNAERHGEAQKCRLTAQAKEDVLHLSLKDNGMGFRKSKLSVEGGHLGLMGLKDRIESLGGKFSINSELGVGTALKLSVGLVDDS